MMSLFYRIRAMILLKWIAIPIMIIGVVAGVVGFIYWYGPTFARYPLWQWPFVPDCPLFAILFVPSLASILWSETRFFQKIKSVMTVYNGLVALGLIKYGIWTDTYWAAYWINSGGHVTIEGVTISRLALWDDPGGPVPALLCKNTENRTDQRAVVRAERLDGLRPVPDLSRHRHPHRVAELDAVAHYRRHCNDGSCLYYNDFAKQSN